MNILILDIESSPHLVNVWKLFKTHITPSQLVKQGEILCWSAKWYQSEEILFDSIFKSTREEMLYNLHCLMNQANAIVTYYGSRFDTPYINSEFATKGFLPPSPYKNIDLYSTVKKLFRFPCNSLDYVSRVLDVGEKIKVNPDIFEKCAADDEESWEQIQTYNANDVTLTEGVYTKLLPWIKTHPNYSTLYNERVCPNCGSFNLQSRGTETTAAMRYQRFQCQNCGKWSRGRTAETNRDNLLLSVN